jgi:hypothetical protein
MVLLDLNLSGTPQTPNHGANVIRVHYKTRRAIELVRVFEYPLTLVLHPAGFAPAK